MVPHLDGMAPVSLGRQIKEICPDIPVILLLPGARGILSELKQQKIEGIDWTFTWSGNTDLLPALVKLTEDRLNDSLKLAAMGKRPKVLIATTYEEAMTLYDQYGSHLLCVISDTRLPRAEKEDAGAGVSILSKIQRDIPEIPLLLMSTETKNKEKARQIPAVFLDKNVSDLNQELHHFFHNHLGFGDFVFRTPEGRQIDRASNLKELEKKLAAIPDESVLFHAVRNHFSIWLNFLC